MISLLFSIILLATMSGHDFVSSEQTDNGGLVNVFLGPINPLAGANSTLNFAFKDMAGNAATVDYFVTITPLQAGKHDVVLDSQHVTGQGINDFTFDSIGDYIATITITSFNGTPISPENAQFEILVTKAIPEFGIITMAALAGAVSGVIIVTQMHKRFARK